MSIFPVPNFPTERTHSTDFDFHAIYTIQLGELIEDGVINFSDSSFDFDYYDIEQRNRLWNKFTNRYYYQEISEVPYKEWKRDLLRKLNEIMPKYKMIYKALSELDPYQIESQYGKSRDIGSDFPQTMLSGNNQDYASTGKDSQFETIHQGNFIEISEKIYRDYNDVDVYILDDLKIMFTCLFSVSMNGF